MLGRLRTRKKITPPQNRETTSLGKVRAQWREDAVAKRAREGIAIDEDEEPLSSSDEFEAEPKSDTEGSKTPERGVEAKSSSSVKRTTVQPVPKKTSASRPQICQVANKALRLLSMQL